MEQQQVVRIRKNLLRNRGVKDGRRSTISKSKQSCCNWNRFGLNKKAGARKTNERVRFTERRARVRAQNQKKNCNRKCWGSFPVNQCTRQINLTNYTRNKRDVSDCPIRIGKFLTPDQPKTHFEESPDWKRRSYFSRHRVLWGFLSSFEDRGVSPTIICWCNIGYLGSSNLPKLKMKYVDGNPLKWGLLLLCINDQCQVWRKQAILRHWQASWSHLFLLNGVFWTVLWCCLEQSGEEILKASCNHLCTTEMSAKAKSIEAWRQIRLN